MLVINETKNRVLAERAVYAGTFWSRLAGWMAKPQVLPGEALILSPCRGVHTFWMRFPIDVLFLDANGSVVYTLESVRPFRVSPVVRPARTVIELPPGTIGRTSTAVGDRIRVIDKNED